MVYYSSNSGYSSGYTASYNTSSIYTIKKPKSFCCGRWRGGIRCGSCPGNS